MAAGKNSWRRGNRIVIEDLERSQDDQDENQADDSEIFMPTQNNTTHLDNSK